LKNSFSIRAAGADDAFSVGALARQFADYLRGLGDTTEFRLTAEAYLRDGFGERPAFAGLVAEEDGCVIGYLLYHFGYDSDRAARTLDIADLYVEQTKRNQGVGRALMNHAAEIARKAGAEELVWAVFHSNDLATKFYGRLGAQQIHDIFLMRLPARLPKDRI
jgi:GNAT superfamily N-acetyltransferase